MAIDTPPAPCTDPSARLFAAAEIVHRNVLWTLGACFVPVPGVDLIAITAVQVKMMAELSALYGVPFREALARKLVLSLLTSAGGQAAGVVIALSLGKVIPGFGFLLGFATIQLLAGAFTHATGRVYIVHLETGGTLLNFDPRAVRDHFRREFATGKRVASDLQATAATTSPRAPSVAAPASPAATSAAPASPAVIVPATRPAGIVTVPTNDGPTGVAASPATPTVITAATPVIPAATPDPLASPVSTGVVLASKPPVVAPAPARVSSPPPVAAPVSIASPAVTVAAALTSDPPNPAASPTGVTITKVHYKGAVKRTQSDEYAEIANLGDTAIDMSGWTLDADGTGQVFTFPPGTELAPGRVIRVYTDEVHPDTGGFKFGIRRAIWNDHGDRARLRDTHGALVSVFAYGDKQ